MLKIRRKSGNIYNQNQRKKLGHLFEKVGPKEIKCFLYFRLWKLGRI